MAFCGRYPVGEHVGLRLTAGAAGYSGLKLCGSVWACPVCSAKILAQRAVEIGGALATAVARGRQLAFVTLTMRHDREQPLELLWGAAGAGWRRATTGGEWQRVQLANGVVGWVRVWEVTYGRNGWHVHVHVALVLDDGDDLDAIAGGMYERWSRGLVDAGLEAPMLVGQDWHLVEGENAGQDIADYLAKLGRSGPVAPEALGLELTHVRPGRSRAGLSTAPVWSLLEALEDGEAHALAAWHEWESASKGKRQVGWSRGLRKLLDVGRERTDDELATDELGTEADTLVAITAEGWGAMCGNARRPPALLDAAENGGLAAVRQLLDEWGDVPYLTTARDA